MKRQFITFAVTITSLVMLVSFVLMPSSSVHAAGATRIEGVGFFDDMNFCDDPEGNGADFALVMTGDLVGCHYISAQDFECSPSGTYRERGTEIFVGTYNGNEGTFETTYLFTAKLTSCPDLATEIFGRCQHPIVVGSGTEGFMGVTGRFDIKDDLVNGNFPYKGHLRW